MFPSEASAEGRLFGEKVLLEEGWLHQDHPSPNPSDVTECVFPRKTQPAVSKPTCHRHLR